MARWLRSNPTISKGYLSAFLSKSFVCFDIQTDGHHHVLFVLVTIIGGGGIYQVTMYGKRKKADLKKCVFYGDISRIGSESVTGLSMAASGYASYKYEFLFTPDRDDVYRLYMIYVPTSIAALDDVLKALIFKLGEPTSQYSSKVQNRLGAMFPKKTYHWKNAVSSIMLSGPSGEVDDMMLQLVQDELQDIATERLESVLATTENPI